MESSGYSFLSSFFHRLTLGSKLISEISFDLEKNIYTKKKSTLLIDEKHLFLSGLARCGTTSILRYLYETKRFASLTYADMPFVLAPNLWKHLSGNTSTTPSKERAHKDGIIINNASPEAFDEVFWKVFLNNSYILKDKLLLNKIPIETMEMYAEYITLINKRYSNGSPKRYLSKNNNNILRLSHLLQKFPNANFIIPFRDPLQHALSLQNQHQNFCSIHQDDRFALKYMNWIGHHEFGMNQKPFSLGNEKLLNEMMHYKKDDINFWLLTWLNYYSFLFTIINYLKLMIDERHTLLFRVCL